MQVKVGTKRIVGMDMLGEIEKNMPYFTARVEALVDHFYGTKAYKYSVKASSAYAVESEEVTSMESMYAT